MKKLNTLCTLVLSTSLSISSFFVFSQEVFAQAEEGTMLLKDPAAALEWQKVDLEERLQSKVQKSVNAAIQNSSFVVNVNITLKEKPKTPETPALPQEDRIPLGKLDLDAPLFKGAEEADTEANLFKNIEKVKVTVILDQSVPETKKNLIQKIVQSSLNLLTPEQLEVNLEQADLSPHDEKDLKRWLIELKLPIGFILAVLILCGLMWALFRGYRTLEFQKITMMEAQNAREQASYENRASQIPDAVSARAVADSLPSATAGIAMNLAKSEDQKGSGFERFRSLLKDSPDKAAQLIKQWIKAPVKEAQHTLAALPQVLTTEEFLVIFQHLPLEDRKVWRKILASSLGTENLEIANHYISSQIVNTLMASGPEMDEDLRNLISDLDVAEAKQIALDSAELGGVLVNLLPISQLSQLYSVLSTEIASRVTVASLSYSPEVLQKNTEKLKMAIQQLKAKIKPQAVPFLEKTAELFTQLSPDKEGSIFNALAESGQYELLQSTAQQFFPSDLILSLPSGILKTCLDHFTLQKRAEFIVSRDSGEQAILSDSVGKPGSKVRDLLDLEIQQVVMDPIRAKRAERAKDNFWKEFVQAVRIRIRGNEIAAEQSEAILNDWLAKKTNYQFGSAMGVQGHETSAPAA